MDLVVYSPTVWPDDETAVATACDIIAVAPVDECLYRVSMACDHEGSEEMVSLEFTAPFGHLDAERLARQVDYFESLRDVEVSFVMGYSKFSGVSDGQLSIREADGDLVLLSLRNVGGPDLLEGESLPLNPPWWSTADNWTAPFANIRATHSGCDETEPLRTGARSMVPLLLEFETDSATAGVLDRQVAYGVKARGSTFDVYAPFAFLRKGLLCGDCGPSEAAVFILRDPDG